MKEAKAKIDKALIALNKGTISGEIKWQPVSLKEIPGLEGYDSLEGRVYCTKHKGKNLCIYKYGARYYVDEDMWHPTTEYRLQFVDENWESEWVFPDNRAIKDLYSSVSYQIANADKFFDDCINDLSEDDLKDDRSF